MSELEDLEVKISNKEAEYETLSRGVAVLLEKHEQLREEFAADTEKAAKKAEKELDKALEDKKKELSRLNKEIIKAKKELESVKSHSEQAEKASNEKLESISLERSVQEEVIARLGTEKLSIESEIEVKRATLTQLDSTINDRRTEVSEVERLIADRSEKLAVVDSEITQADLEFSALRASWEKEEEESQRKLLNLRGDLDKNSRLLAETQNQEEVIRQNLAELSLKLDRREKNIEAREAKVAQQEKRLFNYSKFTQL